MQTQDPLAQLRDIHLPDPVGIWPPAPGWWIVMLIIVTITLFSVHRFYRHYQRQAFRREAIQRWQALKPLSQRDETAQYLQALNLLLKQTALSCHSQEQVAHLNGQDWLHFLDNSLGNAKSNTQAFSQGIGQCLADGPYRQHTTMIELTALHQLAGQWIRRQQRKC